MWRYLFFNALLFAVLVLAHFRMSARGRGVLLTALFGGAIWAATRPYVDPFSWFYYVSSGLVIYWGAGEFYRWVFARSVVLDEELEDLSRMLGEQQEFLSERTRTVESVERKADEISNFYDKIKQMSKSLDVFDLFFIFSQTLADNFDFKLVKLGLFGHNSPQSLADLEDVYEFQYADLRRVVDRSVILKDKNKLKTEAFPFDKKVFEEILKTRKPVQVVDVSDSFQYESLKLGPDFPPFVAHPILIDESVVAVLLIMGLDPKEMSMISILTQRFLSEVKRVKLYEHVQTLAITDGLTGVYVRRHLIERLEGEIDRCKRFNLKLSFLMIDVDFFKTFNDKYGHLVGDVVLKQVAEIIRKSVREVDLVGRYGGEEFGVLLIETDESGSFFVAERIRRAISEKVFLAYDEELKVTVSIGCCTYTQAINETELLVDAADSALYQAKRQGRNRVCLSNLT
jgi:diguanylate cyclase (GGDEF)-like protein